MAVRKEQVIHIWDRMIANEKSKRKTMKQENEENEIILRQ
jgi:hypothetical protein